jgi:hypothetical protein
LSGKNTYTLLVKKWKTGGELMLFSSEKCPFPGKNEPFFRLQRPLLFGKTSGGSSKTTTVWLQNKGQMNDGCDYFFWLSVMVA